MIKILYKDKGISSFQFIKKFAKENNIKKIGHSGTLDPLAKGLILIATDDDTKLIPLIHDKSKEYYVKIKLGYASRTYDSEGPINFISSYEPTKKEIIDCLNTFKGKIKQFPPLFSAKKINGKRAYNLVRDNKKFQLNEISVEIYKITNLKYNYPYIEFSIHVSNGTYIRSLVNDIGLKLKTGAFIEELERIKISNLKLNDKIKIKELLKLPIVSIETQETLLNLYQGKTMEIKVKKNGVNLILFRNEIIGFVSVIEKKLNKIKLFGNRIKKILEIN